MLQTEEHDIKTKGFILVLTCDPPFAFTHGWLGAADGTHGMDFAAAGWLPETFGQAGLGLGTRKGSMKSFTSLESG